MIRADYGGDGVSHTRERTTIDPFDRLGIQSPEPDPHSRKLEFEAAWGPEFAVCVRRTRIPELTSIGELVRHYPPLAGKTGQECSEVVAALIQNRL